MNPKYVPCLKSKAGELEALATLSLSVDEHILPLIDFTPGRCDSTGRPTTTISQDLDTAARRLVQTWSSRRTRPRFILDVRDYGEMTTERGIHPLLYSFERLQRARVTPIIAVGPDRDLNYRVAAQQCLSKSHGEVAVRINATRYLAPQFRDDVDRLLENLGTDPTRAILILDFGFIGLSAVSAYASLALRYLDALSSHAWRAIVVAASGMPEALTTAPGELELRERPESYLFDEVSAARPGLWYGDFSVVNPRFRQLAGGARGRAKIRYTVRKAWAIIRGEPPNRARPDEYAELYRRLLDGASTNGYTVRDDEFSWGDQFLNQCLSPNQRTFGNPQRWVTVDTSHHIAQVLDELAPVFGYNTEPFRIPRVAEQFDLPLMP